MASLHLNLQAGKGSLSKHQGNRDTLNNTEYAHMTQRHHKLNDILMHS